MIPDEEEQAETIRRAMSLIGKRTSPRKAASSAANIAAANAARDLLACTCGRTDGKHATKCPVRRRDEQRKARAKKARADNRWRGPMNVRDGHERETSADTGANSDDAV